MEVIALAAQKGGVGKTTTLINLAVTAHKRGYKTLMIDYDQQGSLATWYDDREEDEPKLALIPNVKDLEDTLKIAEKSGKCDYVFIDTQGAHSKSVEHIIKCSDYVLIPTQAKPKDLEAVLKTAETAESLGLPYSFLLSRINVSSKNWQIMWEKLKTVSHVAGAIRDSVEFDKADMKSLAMCEYAPSGPYARDFDSLFEALQTQLKKISNQTKNKRVA